MSIAAALSTEAKHGPVGGSAQAPPARKARLGAYLLLAPGMVYLFVFFVLPIFALLATSLYERVPGTELGVYEPALRWQNYLASLSSYYPELLRSFGYALTATVAALLIGYPMAYVIAVRARGKPLLQGLLLVLVIAPFFTSFILRTIAWRQILADESWVVGSMKFLGILPPDGRLTATAFAVVCGLTYNFLPFMVLPLFASLERLDRRLLEAGKDLYASTAQTFWRITLPLTMPGIIAGILLTFIPAAGDYVNAIFLGGTSQAMIGNVIQSKYLVINDYPDAAALSFTLMAIILIALLLYIKFAGSEALMGDEEEAQ